MLAFLNDKGRLSTAEIVLFALMVVVIAGTVIGVFTIDTGSVPAGRSGYYLAGSLRRALRRPWREHLATHHIKRDGGEAAVAAAHRLNVLPHLGAGFEVWEDDRLVHRHRN